jgi:CHASE2 domain-containing sensor protein
VRRAIPAILIALLGTYALNRSGVMRGLEHSILDAEMRLHKPPTSPVAIVRITDADYDSIFDGRSPLAVDKLGELIRDIAVSQPLVIGVDIDTSHRQFQTLKLDASWPRVIWERDVYNPKEGEPEKIEPLDVLGGRDPALNQNAGIPALLDDPEDKVTRGYSRCIQTKAGLVPSFAAVLVAAYSVAQEKQSVNKLRVECESDPASSTRIQLIRYSTKEQNRREELSAAELRSISGSIEKGGQNKEIPELYRKIVLLGGEYRDFDRHDTPLGTAVGVEVLANTVETMWFGEGVGLSAPWVLFLVDFFVAALLVILLHVFPTTVKRQLALGLSLAALISVILSLVTFRTASRLAAFAPTLIAVILFEVYVHVREQSVLRAVNVGHAENPSDEKPTSPS